MLLPVLLIVLATALVISQGGERTRATFPFHVHLKVNGVIIGRVLGKEGDVTLTHEAAKQVVRERFW